MDYSCKKDLLDEISKSYRLFIAEFDDLACQDSDLRFAGLDKTPREMIIYQIGWLDLLMRWDGKEEKNEDFTMPSNYYKWNELEDLNRSFYREYEDYSFKELKYILNIIYLNFKDWIELKLEEEIFTPSYKKWTVDKENLPMAGWIEINSVEVFKSFTSLIKKWKKIYYSDKAEKNDL